jgi:hypothetical protein
MNMEQKLFEFFAEKFETKWKYRNGNETDTEFCEAESEMEFFGGCSETEQHFPTEQAWRNFIFFETEAKDMPRPLIKKKRAQLITENRTKTVTSIHRS